MIRRLLAYAKNPLLRLMVPPVAGFLFYGGWAYLVNVEHGGSVAIKALLTQGSYSFVITLSLALAIEFMYQKMKNIPYGATWVTILASLMLYVSSWSVNALAGTPNIVLTILPGAVVSTIYTALYVWTLVKVSQ